MFENDKILVYYHSRKGIEAAAMREGKCHIYLNEEERKQIIISPINLKNKLLDEGRYTDAVDDVICKVLSSKKIKI